MWAILHASAIVIMMPACNSVSDKTATSIYVSIRFGFVDPFFRVAHPRNAATLHTLLLPGLENQWRQSQDSERPQKSQDLPSRLASREPERVEALYEVVA